MTASTKLSIVIPVRDDKDAIAQRVEEVLDTLIEVTENPFEIVVVDDGSADGTREVLDDLERRFLQVRLACHTRPRGMEAAGQTGLERSTCDLVFIQETNTPVRIPDLKRLWRMSEDDDSVVAARAESTPRPASKPLMRRIKAWGTNATEADLPEHDSKSAARSCLQMLRRPHLQHLASPAGKNYQLHGETLHSTTVEQPS